MRFRNFRPRLAKNVFVAPGARIIGRVIIGQGSSVWFNAVLRGDKDRIAVGRYSNLQDNSTLHTSKHYPVEIGDYVSVGHNCIVHGASIGSNTLVGMGAEVLNGAMIGENSIIGAGALVTEGKEFPPNSLILGMPARLYRKLEPREIEENRQNALNYSSLAEEYTG